MFFKMSSGVVAVAVNQTAEDLAKQLGELKDKYVEQVVSQLIDGAKQHNSVIESDIAALAKMREAAERDVEHHLQNHPLKERVSYLENLKAVTDALPEGTDVYLDEMDFSVLKGRLQVAPPERFMTSNAT